MLTKNQIAALKPKKKRYIVLADAHLYVAVHPTGEKTWLFRKTVNRKQLKKSLGSLDKVSYYDAKRKRDDLLEQIEVSGSVVSANAELTFGEVAEEWMEKRCIPMTGEKNVNRQRSRLDRLVLPIIGSVPCRSITASTILTQILRPIEARGQNDLAHAVKELISMILRFGVACCYTERDVTVDLTGALQPVVVQHFPHLTDKREIAELLKKISALPPCSSKYALLLCAYTFVRPSEAREAKWEEFDLVKAEWQIPAERMKKRRKHIVPLSRQVLTLLQEAKAFAGNSPYVCPSPRIPGLAISADAYKSTLQRLGYTSGTMTAHGFRSIASTLLNDHHWDWELIELQLSHEDQNKVRSAYNHAKKLDIREKMMQWYADYLDSLRLGLPEPPMPK